MKYFSTLLVLYFFYLFTLPCSEEIKYSNAGAMVIVSCNAISISINDDICSPFCNCNSCHVNIIVKAITKIREVYPEEKPLGSIVIKEIALEATCNIWHPPHLC